jgi:hypothetical protein
VKVLFFVRELPYVQRIYAPLLDELVDRGHEVQLAFTGRESWDEIRGGLTAFERPGLTAGIAPRRGPLDGWRQVAWNVRAISDLARFADPRFAQASRLRTRVTKNVLARVEKATNLEPLGRALAQRVARRLASRTDASYSTRVIAAARRLERAIPTSPEIDRFVREHAPDVVLVTPVVKYGSDEVEYLKSARRLGIPAATLVASWDNLTNKGLLKWVPERVFVWNEAQRRDAIELHGIPADRVVATGAQLFDAWFEQRPSRSRERFLARVGLDPGRPYLLYLCSSPFVAGAPTTEIEFVRRLLEELRASTDERLRGLGVIVRPYPGSSQWLDVDLRRYENAAVWPPGGRPTVTERARASFFDSLAHSAAAVGINTTAMIEAAIAGKPVLTILEPQFVQEDTLHFQYLLAENGGFLHAASSLDEHLAQLSRVLDEDEAGAGRRRRFLESFVRPHGLDRPATPILADAVEELAAVPVEKRVAPSCLLLRAPLAVEAALAGRRGARRDGLKRRRRAHRVGAAAESS